MANEVKLKAGAQFTFADHATDFVGGAAGSSLEQAGSTDVQIDLTSLADGAARQSAKFDLGATWAREHSIDAAFEIAATPVDGEAIELYIAWSPDATAANGNPGGVSGSDAAFTGYSSNLSSSVKQLDRVGTFVCTVQATGTVQVQTLCGLFIPRHRYGTLVVKNESGAALHSDAVEIHVVIQPAVDEIQ